MPARKSPSEINSGNLKGLWLQGEASGTRADSSGNSNTLTDNNTVTAREGFRQARSAYYALANSEYLSIVNGSQTGLNITGSLSFFCRVKFDSMATTQYFMSRGGATVNGYAFSTNGSALRFYVNTTEYAKSLAVTLTTARWYDFLVVFDSVNDTVTFYIDGFNVGTVSSATATITSNTSTFILGANTTPGQYLDGQMETAAIWDATVTAAQAMSLSCIDDIFGKDTGGEEHLRSSASLNVKIAQSFNPKVTGYFDAVILNAYKNNSPTGDMWVTIETDSAGAPSGVAVATSEVIDVSLVRQTTINEIAFRFQNAFQLTAGSTYWIVVQGNYSSSSTVGIRFTRSSGGAGNYTGGAAFTYNGTSWSAISTDDFNFRMQRIVGNLIDSHFVEAGTNDGGELYSNGNIVAYAQNIKFTSVKSVKGAAFWMGMFGSPSGTLTAKLYANNAGAPGTLLATSAAFNRNIGWKSASPSTYTNGGLWYLEFATPFQLSANTEYWLVLEASAGGSGSDYNRPAFTSGNGYASTYDEQKYQSGAWSLYSANFDLQFALFEDIQQNQGNFFPFLQAA